MKSLSQYIREEWTPKEYSGVMYIYPDNIEKFWDGNHGVALDVVLAGCRKVADGSFEIEEEEGEGIYIYGPDSWSREEAEKYFGKLESYITQHTEDGFVPQVEIFK